MSVIVQRQPADKPGDEIISSVLTTTDAQRERGAYEINSNMDDRIILDGATMGLDFIQPGTMVTTDSKGIMKNGLVTQFGGRVTVNDSGSKLTIETIK